MKKIIIEYDMFKYLQDGGREFVDDAELRTSVNEIWFSGNGKVKDFVIDGLILPLIEGFTTLFGADDFKIKNIKIED